jgi:hypothetical protein
MKVIEKFNPLARLVRCIHIHCGNFSIISIRGRVADRSSHLFPLSPFRAAVSIEIIEDAPRAMLERPVSRRARRHTSRKEEHRELDAMRMSDLTMQIEIARRLRSEIEVTAPVHRLGPSEVARGRSNDELLRGETPMPGKTQYAVKFVGYSAHVIARRNEREYNYAHLDFVTGGASVHAERGWAMATSRVELTSLVRSLPNHARELRDLVRQRDAHVPDQSAAVGIVADATSDWINLRSAKTRSVLHQTRT